MNIATNQKEESNIVSDSVITAKIKAKFAVESDLSAIGIHVETSDGTVTLKGEVPNDAAIKKAIKIAQNTDGVNDVKSVLDIESE